MKRKRDTTVPSVPNIFAETKFCEISPFCKKITKGIFVSFPLVGYVLTALGGTSERSE